jgi:hypothetical protein
MLLQNKLSNTWTPTHVVEPSLLCGLWFEAAKFSVKVGDWKRGLMLCLLYSILCKGVGDSQEYSDKSDLVVQVEQFAHRLAKGKILRALGLSRGRPAVATPGSEHPQPDLHHISSTLRACEKGGLSGICPAVTVLVHQRLWRAVGSLPARVPEDFPLPASPLYCSPAANKELPDDLEEAQRRLTLGHLVRSSLGLLWASNSLDLCRGWYSHALAQLHCESAAHPSLRHMPCANGSITGLVIPPSLEQHSSGCAAPVEDLPLSVQCQMGLFRELCGLLWLLHVRDTASLLLRKPDMGGEPDSGQTLPPERALWCARLVPLKHCLQDPSYTEDVLLSVLSELPGSQLTATLLAQSFPDGQASGCRKLKMERLLGRMRTPPQGEGGMGRPLSVDYQVMSQTVLKDQASGSLRGFSPLCLKSDSGSID